MSTPPLPNNNNTPGSNTDPATLPATGASPSPADIDKMVASYLQKKGYKATEAIFIRESKGDTVSLEDVGEGVKKKENTTEQESLPPNNKTTAPATAAASATVVVAAAAEPEEKKKESSSKPGDPDAYHVSYKSLRQWIENSLDWYKVIKNNLFEMHFLRINY